MFLLPFEASEKNNVGLCRNMILFKVLEQASDSSKRRNINCHKREGDYVDTDNFLTLWKNLRNSH